MRLSWLFGALLLTAILAGTHLLALEQYLYWKFTWFDIPMHALGGVVIGAFIAPLIHKGRRALWFFVWCVLLFIAWEVFEYMGGISKGPDLVPDTALDLVMDTLGALIPLTLAQKLLWRSA